MFYINHVLKLNKKIKFNMLKFKDIYYFYLSYLKIFDK